MATPQPPTRLTVSGGPKAEPHLSMRTIDTPKRDPYRMAHPMTLRDRMHSGWAATLLIILVMVLFLVFGVDVR
jgi:hypothetical protein